MVKIKGLYEICEGHRTHDTWYDRLFVRKIAILITWVLIHTPITANQVTFIHTILVIFGAGLFFMNNQTYNIIGSVLILLGFLLDRVDGQVARYRKKMSNKGYFLDYFGHFLSRAIFFSGISISYYLRSNNIVFLFLGFSSVIFWFHYHYMYQVRYYFLYTDLKRDKNLGEEGSSVEKKPSIVSRVVRFINNSIFQNLISEGVMLSLLFILSLINRTEIMLIVYGTFFPIYSIASFIHLYFVGLDSDVKKFKNEIIKQK